MTSMDLDPVDRITAGAVGPPGERTFYLQARSGDDVATFLVEKQQVQLLSASILEILARVGKETGGRVRRFAPREQMLSLSRHGALVAAQGGPTCQFCGNPIDPEGHVCPAMNGHGRLDRS